jgi:5'-nucleotidase
MNSLIGSIVCYLAIYFPNFEGLCNPYLKNPTEAVSSFLEISKVEEELINISDYQWPLPKNNEDEIYNIAIFGTNDIHGGAFAQSLTHPITKENFKYGGLEYLSNYIQIIKNDWREKFLWLDAGDQFQGTIESKTSNGSIITDFMNFMKLNGSAIGNHEFDFFDSYLDERLRSASWEYLASNIFNETTQKSEFLPNTKSAKLYQVGEVKIGVIGLTTIESPYTTSGNVTGIKFDQYNQIVIQLSNSLRSEGAKAVVVTSHVGISCNYINYDKHKLGLHTVNTKADGCKNETEIYMLLNSLPEGTIDAVVGGHTHELAHHFINNIPVIQTTNGGFYSHVLYLNFDKKNNYKLIKSQTSIEGPLPNCERVFSKHNVCEYVSKSMQTDAGEAGELRNYKFHNQKITGNPEIQTLFQPWWEKIAKYKVKLASTEFPLAPGKQEENSLGNLVCDLVKLKTGADIVVLNDGSLRTSWYPGDILVESVYNMQPFDNTLLTFEMTGAEVKKMLFTVQGGDKSFYHTSGVQQIVSVNPKKKLISVKLANGNEIRDDQIFRVACSDYLIGGGDDFRNVKTWYTPRNIINFGLFRDAMIEGLPKIKNIPEEGWIDNNHRRLIIQDNLFMFDIYIE